MLCVVIVVTVTMIRTYSELIRIPTFEERFEYLKLNGQVGTDTFGFDRYLNQRFYTSKEWRSIRDYVIVRDNGNDLGIAGLEIDDHITIHHMNPITADDIISRRDYCLEPEFLICVSDLTHKAIHYGDYGLLIQKPVERFKNDTIPWRK